MEINLDIDNAIINSNRIEDFFDRNTVNVDLRKYGLFLRASNGVNIEFYETRNMGYVLEDVTLVDIIKETWVKKSIWNNITLLSPNYDSLFVPNKTTNLLFKIHELTKVEGATIEELCNNIPNYFNIIIFDINGISEFGAKTPEVMYEYVEQLNDLIDMDGFVKIYKKSDMFFIFND